LVHALSGQQAATHFFQFAKRGRFPHHKWFVWGRSALPLLQSLIQLFSIPIFMVSPKGSGRAVVGLLRKTDSSPAVRVRSDKGAKGAAWKSQLKSRPQRGNWASSRREWAL
jgi:hypothetical protein